MNFKDYLKENPTTRFKKALHGVLPNVYSFVIMTSENPMGQKSSREENKKRLNDFQKLLKDGRYQYVKVKGKYGNVENPYMVFNVNIEDAKNMSKQFDQESFIFAENKKDKDVTKNRVVFNYWEKPKEGEYQLKDKVDRYTNEDDAKDFYTSMKSWKFNIPFPMFEEIIQVNPYEKYELNEGKINEINKINKDICSENNYTGQHLYKLRGHINHIIKR